jgi:RND superfamily putative drug exporter
VDPLFNRAEHFPFGLVEDGAGAVARAADARVGIGGPAPVLQDFDSATSSRSWLLLLLLVAVTYAVLVLVVRSLLAPLVAVLLSVLAVRAAFGLVEILFEGAAPPLGGPGFVDAIMASGIFTLAFALSIDYQVFLLGFAVLLDATLVRLVLLPAALRLAGPRAWWFPRSLDRVLPRTDAVAH